MTSLVLISGSILSFFLTWLSLSAGAVVVSPSPRAEVCHVGERLKVMCSVINSTATILQWNLNFTSEIGVANHLSITISTTRTSIQREELDSIVFSFRRSSQLGVLPLASTLDITHVKNSLNGTRISCTEQINSNTATEAGSTTVFIIGENPGYYHPRTPGVEYDNYFGTDMITVSLWWTNDSELENPLVGYHVYVTPNNDVDNTIISVTSTSANVTLSYNTPYNVSVVANFCGQSNATANIELNYVKCGHPLDEEMENATVVVTGYQAPALEGTSVNFTCISGLVLTGPKSSTCMSDELWEPHPREAKCKVNCNSPPPPINGYIIPYTSTLEGATVIYICNGIHFTATCNKEGSWEPNVSDICHVIQLPSTGLSPDGKIAVGSSVTVFILSSVFFYVLGFVSRHFCPKCENRQVEIASPLEETITPMYEDIKPKIKEEELELKTNVAYGPVSKN